MWSTYRLRTTTLARTAAGRGRRIAGRAEGRVAENIVAGRSAGVEWDNRAAARARPERASVKRPPPFLPPSTSNPVTPPLVVAPPLTPLTPYPSSGPSPIAPRRRRELWCRRRRAPQQRWAGLRRWTLKRRPKWCATWRRRPKPPAAPGHRRHRLPTASCRASSPPSWTPCKRALDEGRFADAHLALSRMYGNPDLPPEQAKRIIELLDQLAGTVIYSRKHHLERAYVTQPGDTLDQLSRKYNVPWQLLARINGLMPPGPQGDDSPTKDQPLPVGMEMKVVRGPFDAVVRLDKHELTLMVQNRYAGRFRIGVGRDQPTLDGDYTVRDEDDQPGLLRSRRNDHEPQRSEEPAGRRVDWVDAIASASTAPTTRRPSAATVNRGTICVGDRDLQDLYGILSVGSRVTILR